MENEVKKDPKASSLFGWVDKRFPLTETWNYDIRTINEMFPQYSAFSSNRINRNGGGAAVLIKSHYASSVIDEYTVNQS